MDFASALNEHFPNAIEEKEFVDNTYETLQKYGFTRDNTIACVSVCRDEVTVSLENAIQTVWGEAFNLSSLAGLVFAGKTAFLAAHHHSPNKDGRERYAYFGFSHIGIGPEGELGWVKRPGQAESVQLHRSDSIFSNILLDRWAIWLSIEGS